MEPLQGAVFSTLDAGFSMLDGPEIQYSGSRISYRLAIESRSEYARDFKYSLARSWRTGLRKAISLRDVNRGS